MHHFDKLSPTQRDELLTDGKGSERTTPYSLANVLHSVSAAELKAEEMIKLPVVLETEPN